MDYLYPGKRRRGRERSRSLLFFLIMDQQGNIQAVTRLVEQLLQGDPDCFLVQVQVKPTDNLMVYLDADQGMSIEKCVAFNRKLYRKITEEGLYPEGAFSLEVSSPGVDEPLRLHRQYVKNIGRQVEMVGNDGSVLKGRLVHVTEEGIAVEIVTGKGKKQVSDTRSVLFTDIRRTTVQVMF